jgi:hypothetical protein
METTPYRNKYIEDTKLFAGHDFELKGEIFPEI